MDKVTSLHIAIDSIATTSNWIDILSALLVPTIAVAGIYIANQQYRVNQQRLKHKLYERRLVIFKHMKTYLSEIFRSGKVTYDRAMKFNYDVAEATFLFDENIDNRIKEIYTKSIKMASLQSQIYDEYGISCLAAGDERTRIVNEQTELLIWLTNQLGELKPLFGEYLGLS